MKRPKRDIASFSISAIDLFASAMGAFMIITVILFPYYLKNSEIVTELRKTHEKLEKSEKELKGAKRQIAKLIETVQKLRPKRIDLVIAVDTTGSMRNEVRGLRQEIRDLVKVLVRISPSVAIGVIDFKDRNDNPTIRSFPLRQVSVGSGSLSALQNFLNVMSARSGPGNQDQPEAVGRAMNTALAMEWRNHNGIHAIVVITDNPAYPEEVERVIAQARSFVTNKNGMVSGVNVGRNGRAFLQRLSQAGNGKFVEAGGSMTAALLLAMLR